MQVCCKVYGLANTSLGIECALDRDLLAVGKRLQYHDRTYVFVSVVESQGYWFANVIPEDQCQHLRRPVQRPHDNTESRERLEEWRQRALKAESQVHLVEEEQAQLEARLDRLMGMLELLTKEPETHQHEQPRPVQRRRGGEHVR
jgi:predicted RNase H-like nuclease (RuvC/YqgF family)